MSDSEQYTEKCGHCNCTLTENVHIFVLAKGIKEQTWCADCVQTFWQDLKSDGWTADDETWSELGFDGGAESEEDDIDAPNIYPYKKCSVCSERSSCGNYNDDKQWICESCNPESEEESLVICSARCERPATTTIKNCPVCDECKEQMSK